MNMHPVARIGDNGLPEYFAGASQLPNGTPLYTAPPVPRDVLIAFGADVLKECTVTCDVFGDLSTVDLAAIADRYASQVQPEPVNQQLLSALKEARQFLSMDRPINPLKIIDAAILAAEAARQPEGAK